MDGTVAGPAEDVETDERRSGDLPAVSDLRTPTSKQLRPPHPSPLLVSPFSPLLRAQDRQLQQQQTTPRAHRRPEEPRDRRWFDRLSLAQARKVSIVVHVEEAPRPPLQARKPRPRRRGNSVGNIDQEQGNGNDVCLFPMVDSATSSGAGSYCSSQEIVVVNPTAFGSQLKLPASVTLETARLVSLLSRKQQQQQSAAASASSNTTEDWIRSYRFSHVVWSAPLSATGAPSTASSSTPPPTAPARDPATSWTRLCRAAAGDVAAPGSIARRTFIGLGGGARTAGSSVERADPPNPRRAASKVAAALSPSSVSSSFQDTVPGRTALFFGSVATESVAHVLANDRNLDAAGGASRNEAFLDDPGPVVHRYGLLGLACCHVLHLLHQDGRGRESGRAEENDSDDEDEELLIPTQSRSSQILSRQQRRQRRLTLSILEIADEDVLYDLLKLKPFARENTVLVKHGRATPSGSGAASGTTATPDNPLGAEERTMSAATLVGLTDTPIDSVRTLGRCVRRAFTMAYHARRTKPRGSLLATLKVWDDYDGGSNPSRHTTLQFLDLAQVVPEDDGNFWRESQKPRNARLRQSVTALGSTLRRVLLREAGNSTAVSYRSNTLTQVLSRDLSQQNLDSKIVLLASLSALKADHSETMSTLRFLSSIVTRPGDPLLSPFDKLNLRSGRENSSDVVQTDNHTKATSSPTSQSSVDADSFLSSSPLLQQAFLRSVVVDPRQRMAKLLGPAKSRPDGSVSGLVDGTAGDGGPPTLTRYMEVDPGGDVADEFARHAEEMAQRGEIAAAGSLGAPLSSPSRTDSLRPLSPSDPVSSAKADRGVAGIDTGFALGGDVESDMEGSELGGHQLHANPSPLTTDTGDRSANFDFRRGDEFHSRRGMSRSTKLDAEASSSNTGPQYSEDVLAAIATRHEIETARLTDKSRRLEETVEILRQQIAQAREEANPDLARDRHAALVESEVARQQLEAELADVERLARGKDADLLQAQHRVEALQRQLESAQQESDVQAQLLSQKFEADSGLVQARLETELERLQLTVQARDDQIADLKSIYESQRAQSQLHLEEALAQAEADRKKFQGDRLERSRLEQEVELHRQELSNRDASYLRLQGEYAAAQCGWQRSKEQALAEADEKTRQLELATQEYAETLRHELQHREDQLRRVEETLASERLAQRETRDEATQRLLREFESARAEAEKRATRIQELEATVEGLEAGRKEILQIADEAIRQQAGLEKALADLEHRSVSRERLQAAEESYARVSQELQESRQELLSNKTELSEVHVRVAELEFAVQSLERERDHLAQRDSASQQDIARLRSSLEASTAARDELQGLGVENRRLQDELHEAQSLRSKYELELEQQLTEREYDVERCHEEVALAREELAAVVEQQSGARRAHDNEAADLRDALKASELKAAQLVEAASHSKELDAPRPSIVTELELATRNLELRVSEVNELSKRLESAQQERDAAVAKASKLKRALVSFQDTTRSKVQTFVHHRSETQALLERTLEENEALAARNNQLQAALEDLKTNPAGPLGRELDQAATQMQQARHENRELRALVGRLETTIESLRAEMDVDRDRPDRLSRQDERRPEERAEGLLRRALDERTASLLAENRRLEEELRAYRFPSRYPPEAIAPATRIRRTEAESSSAVPALSNRRSPADLVDPLSSDLVANLAVAARTSAERSEAELARMQDRLSLANSPSRAAPVDSNDATRQAKVRALHRRVSVLETHRAVVEGLVLGQQVQLRHEGRNREAASPSHNDRAQDSDSSVSSGDSRRRRGTLSRGRGWGRDRHRFGARLEEDMFDGLRRRVRSLERRMDKGWIEQVRTGG